MRKVFIIDSGKPCKIQTPHSHNFLTQYGKSFEEYENIGMNKTLILTSNKGIYCYYELQIKERHFFDKADHSSKESVEICAKQIKQSFEKILIASHNDQD